MNERILCVDDEPNVLAGYQRQLRKQFAIEIARGGEEGLAALAHGPFAVIVSDMRMPGMNGAQLLAHARTIAPDTVRMLLTGHADQHAAIAAVNEGNIFRFLTKPCSPEAFSQALAAGVKQYRLVTSEKELLEKTLRGSVKVLTEVLALVNPVAFGRAARVWRLALALGNALHVDNVWQLEVAAMLSQLGCVTVPEAVLEKGYRGASLAADEQSMFERSPQIGQALIGKVPRLEAVAEIIAYQQKRFDGKGCPGDGKAGTAIPLGARILKVALDLDSLERREHSRVIALDVLKSRPGWYDPAVLAALEGIQWEETSYRCDLLPIADMTGEMILGEDIVSSSGILLVRKGQEITEALLQRLRNVAGNGAIREPVKMLVPRSLFEEASV